MSVIVLLHVHAYFGSKAVCAVQYIPAGPGPEAEKASTLTAFKPPRANNTGPFNPHAEFLPSPYVDPLALKVHLFSQDFLSMGSVLPRSKGLYLLSKIGEDHSRRKRSIKPFFWAGRAFPSFQAPSTANGKEGDGRLLVKVGTFESMGCPDCE